MVVSSWSVCDTTSLSAIPGTWIDGAGIVDGTPLLDPVFDSPGISTCIHDSLGEGWELAEVGDLLGFVIPGDSPYGAERSFASENPIDGLDLTGRPLIGCSAISWRVAS